MAEYSYTIEINYDETPQQKPLIFFASKIQAEVGNLGGRVIAAWLENGKHKIAKVAVSFKELDELRGYIEWYYENDFNEEEIAHELSLIEEKT
jgi:hypothetical protein